MAIHHGAVECLFDNLMPPYTMNKMVEANLFSEK